MNLSPEVAAFLNEIIEVCKKHNLSISHEDRYGNFEIEKLSQINIRWLLNAKDLTKKDKPCSSCSS
jgi:hypothetical protein